jgi:hypothetical protein
MALLTGILGPNQGPGLRLSGCKRGYFRLRLQARRDPP